MALLLIINLYDFLFSFKQIDGRTKRLTENLTHPPIGRIPTGDPNHLRGRAKSIKQVQKSLSLVIITTSAVRAAR